MEVYDMASDITNIESSSAQVFTRGNAVKGVQMVEGQAVFSSSIQNTEVQSEQLSLEDALAQLQEFSNTMRRSLNFSIDEESGRSVVRVLDAETDKVVRQIPTEEAINIAQNIERIKGILFEDQV